MRIIRGDLSDRLIHLTRSEADNQVLRDREAMAKFWSIVRSRKLIGSSRNIRGGFKCVCFSEAPVSVLTHMLADQSSRYAPLGVMVDKTWLFSMGGRPVIYQPAADYNLLPPELQYRHVRYDPTAGSDFTWEREWRIKCDDLPLNPASVTLVVPSRTFVESAKEQHLEELQDTVWALGDVAGGTVESLPWHFLALEDLGLRIDFG